MAYVISVENKVDYLLIRVSGVLSYENESQLDSEIARVSEVHGIRRVLIDLRRVEGEMTAAEAYQLATEIPKPGLLRKEALVDVSEHSFTNYLFGLVASNRGLNIRNFTDIDKAEDWLRRD